MIMTLAFLPAFGGLVASPTWGYMAFVIPVGYFAAVFLCARVFTFSLEDVHAEARKVLKVDEAPPNKCV